jgi:hypothetical protein
MDQTMSKDIRCFVAIDLPQELKQMLDDYIVKLRSLAPKVKWVKEEKFAFFRRIPQG